MIGTTLSHFRITAKLGEGGMGEVYRAEDSKLGREVAIKVLPEAVAGDPERLARFEREAKVLASLNHPHIAGIHQVEEANGVHFLVMELAEGENLGERLERGPIRVDEALAIARQIAEALEAAHEKGIIHRDLKPANIVVTPDGEVKILDFGLAKALDPTVGAAGSVGDSPAALSLSPTLTAQMTGAGVILGTAAYMSPEQASGKPVDRRADIWAFGVVLHEMLSGQRLFAGDTVAETLASVIMKEPDLEVLPDETPRPILELLERCLRKNPHYRLRDMGDVRILLEETQAGGRSGLTADEPAEERARRGLGSRMLLGALVLLALTGAAILGRLTAKPAAPAKSVNRFEIPLSDSVSASQVDPRLSPDGRWIAYGSGDGLRLRELGQLEPRALDGTQGATSPFWSPDSAWVGFAREDRLWKVPVSGGTASLVCVVPDGWSTTSGGAVWGADGRIVFTNGDSGLYSVSVQGGDPTILHDVAEGEEDFHDVAGLPGGGHLFVVHRQDGSMGRVDGVVDGVRFTIVEHPDETIDDPVFSTTGHVLYRRRGASPGIWAVPVSGTDFRPTGEPFLAAAGGRRPSLAADGTLLYYRGNTERQAELVLVDRQGTVLQTVGSPGNFGPFPSISPDGKKVAIEIHEGEVHDIWLHDLARGTRTRASSGEGDKWIPLWSEDGERLYYSVFPERETWVTRADGSSAPQRLTEGAVLGISPDEKWMGLEVFAEETRDIWIEALDNPDERRPLLATPAEETWPRISPDERYLAYQSNESGRDEVYLQPFPDGGRKWQVSTDGGNWPVWSKDGSELFYVRGDSVMSVRVDLAGDGLALGTPTELFTRNQAGYGLPFDWPEGFDVSADGQTFLILADATADGSVRGSIILVQNWSAEFTP